MAVPDITLNAGQVLLHQVSSGLGIEVDNSGFLNGYVDMINDLSDLYAAGDLVLFDPSQATMLKYDSVDYFLTTENKIYYKEILPP